MLETRAELKVSEDWISHQEDTKTPPDEDVRSAVTAGCVNKLLSVNKRDVNLEEVFTARFSCALRTLSGSTPP